MNGTVLLRSHLERTSGGNPNGSVIVERRANSGFGLVPGTAFLAGHRRSEPR